MKIGDYVRTEKGIIGKLVEEYTFNNGKVIYPEPQEWVLDINGNEIAITEDLDILIKSSPNIKDLLEVGDFVTYRINNQQIDYFCFVGGGYNDFEEPILIVNREKLEDIEITSVITREQMRTNSYEVNK